MTILDAIRQRHSTRSFQSRPIPKEILEQIVDAGRLAATARNDQPWEFAVVTKKDILDKITEIADHGKFINQASACVAVFCKNTKYYLEDGSAATENMLVAAAALGAQSCWVAGDKKHYAPQINSLLGAPSELKLVSLVALGYEAVSKPRPVKRTLGNVLHWETF